MAWFKDLATVEIPALGFLEFSSISRGLVVTDLLIKKSPIRMIKSQPVSSGKHVILYFGDVAAVEEAHIEAKKNSHETLMKDVLIPSVHEKLVPFLESIWNQKRVEKKLNQSVGIIESYSLSGAILSADTALKEAPVELCRMRLGQGIGGKAFYLISGVQEDVEASLEAARNQLENLESLCRVDLIANPFEESLSYF